MAIWGCRWKLIDDASTTREYYMMCMPQMMMIIMQSTYYDESDMPNTRFRFYDQPTTFDLHASGALCSFFFGHCSMNLIAKIEVSRKNAKDNNNNKKRLRKVWDSTTLFDHSWMWMVCLQLLRFALLAELSCCHWSWRKLGPFWWVLL